MFLTQKPDLSILQYVMFDHRLLWHKNSTAILLTKGCYEGLGSLGTSLLKKQCLCHYIMENEMVHLKEFILIKEFALHYKV